MAATRRSIAKTKEATEAILASRPDQGYAYENNWETDFDAVARVEKLVLTSAIGSPIIDHESLKKTSFQAAALCVFGKLGDQRKFHDRLSWACKVQAIKSVVMNEQKLLGETAPGVDGGPRKSDEAQYIDRYFGRCQ